ncbi:MAG: AAA family ATPase [bacterium]
MYYEYWGMQKAPFDNVPDPGLYWSQNSSVEDAVSEILFAIEDGNDCLAVLVGDIGTGKTLSLRVILNELNPEKYRIAFITNPELSLSQFMREIIGQLRNKKVATHFKDQLMEEFNAILFECANQGQKVVIFIDEANVMSTAQLNNLRLMTNLQDDQQNMVIFVLAGQKELARRLESRSLENLYQRIGVYCRIKGLSGPEDIRQYLAHRIRLCGGSPEIFTKEAAEVIWTCSRGVPRLVNKLAKLCLKAGETNQVRQIDADMVQAIASMFEREKALPIPDDPITKPPSPADHIPAGLDSEIAGLIQWIPSYLHSQISSMEEKQLQDLAGKIAVQYVQQTQPKNSHDDPVILWDKAKGRIFSALKLLQEHASGHPLHGGRRKMAAACAIS